MKNFLATVITGVLSLLVVAAPIHAEPVGTVTEPQPALQASPLIVTAYHVSEDNVDFVQIYNNSNQPVNLADWQIMLLASNDEVELEIILAEPDTWLVPRGLVVVADRYSVPDGDVLFEIPAEVRNELANIEGKDRDIVLRSIDENVSEYWLSVVHLAPNWGLRSKISTGYSTTAPAKQSGKAQLEGRGLYEPVQTSAGLRIVEILPNARNCSPTETDIDCGDYIKLHNPTDAPIELSDYRLRTDSGGLGSSSSNTFSLNGSLGENGFRTVYLRDTGDRPSITNSGGYVWLEDTYGIVTFEPIVSYPDASADSKKGLSWALDDNDSTWKWMTPAPEGTNYWLPTVIGPNHEGKGGLSDCGPGRERNPATNRCRMVASASTSLVPCRDGQVRNPETNRCRSAVTAGSTLTPCKPGQIRNPETNRCKSAASTASTLVPCNPGQERNPETNRCRRVQGAATSVGNIQDIDVGAKASMTGWYVAGGALLLVAGYGIYEWRQDIALRLRKLLRK